MKYRNVKEEDLKIIEEAVRVASAVFKEIIKKYPETEDHHLIEFEMLASLHANNCMSMMQEPIRVRKLAKEGESMVIDK